MTHTISIVFFQIYFAISLLNIISCIWLSTNLQRFLTEYSNKKVTLNVHNAQINGLVELIEELWNEKKRAHHLERLSQRHSRPEPSCSSD